MVSVSSAKNPSVYFYTEITYASIGQSTAFKWYSAGCRTLEDVRVGKNGVTLSPAQEIGLRFYDGQYHKRLDY